MLYVTKLFCLIAAPRTLLDFDRNENYLIIDSCSHPCTATSIDPWVSKFYCLVN